MAEESPERGSMVRVVHRADGLATDDELAYWASQPPSARIAAVEVLRRRVFGGGADEPGSRLERVVRIVDRA